MPQTRAETEKVALFAQLPYSPENNEINLIENRPEIPPEPRMADNRTRGSNVQIPVFGGGRNENFKTWLSRFEIIFQSNNWPDANKPATLAAHLANRAFHEYEALDDQTKQDYENLKAALLEKFCSPDTQRFARQTFMHRQQKPGESVSEYADVMTDLANLALSSQTLAARDTMLMEQFVFGLLPQTRRDILLADPQTFAEALNLAQRIEGLDGYNNSNQFQELVSAVGRELGGTRPDSARNAMPNDRWYKGRRSNRPPDRPIRQPQASPKFASGPSPCSICD